MSGLARHPEATTYALQDLVLNVRRGRIRVPRFQRSFQWERDDVVALFDSIYRGFPVGNLLLWKHPARAERVEVGPIVVDAPELVDARWVVDGQQRITALAGALLRPSDTSDDRFNVYFDLATEQFLVPGNSRNIQALWLPLHVALDAPRRLEWLMSDPTRPIESSHKRAASRLARTLAEYRVPAYVVEAEDEGTLRVIFERMNTTGKAREQADVFNALFAEPSPPPSRLDELAQDLAAVGFGEIDEATLLESVLAIAGLEATRPIESYKDTPALAGAVPRAGQALRLAISFLREDASVPHVDLMPATFPLLSLARFFALHPDPSARSRVLLSRWVWRAFVDHLRHGHHPSRARSAAAAIDEAEEESIQRLLATASRTPWRPAELPRYDWQSGATKLVLTALAALAPCDLTSGLPIDLPGELARLGSQLVQRIDPTSNADGHGNRFFQKPPPDSASPSYADPLAGTTEAIRRSHLVRLEEGRPESAEARERALISYVEGFAAARMAVTHGDRPSIKYILAQAADDDAA